MSSINKRHLQLHAKQMEVYKNPSRFRVVCAGRRFGKCVDFSTLITMADGSEKQAKDIVAGDSILTFNEDTYKIEPKRVTAVQSNGVREVVRVSTNAHSVVCTPNHPFLVNNEWIEAKDLKRRDLVGVPKRTAFGHLTMNQHELDLLAAQLADGCDYVITKPEGPIIDMCREACNHLGMTLRNIDKFDWKFDFEEKGNCHGSKNPLRLMLERFGVWGLRSKTKFIPKDIFYLNKEQLRRFISVFVGCDGSVTHVSKETASIEIQLANEKMVKQFQSLLMKFGVHGRIYKKVHKAKSVVTGENFVSWKFIITDSKYVIRYCETIGAFGKEDKCEIALKKARASRGNCNAYYPITYDDFVKHVVINEDDIDGKRRRAHNCLFSAGMPKEFLSVMNSWRKQTRRRISRPRYEQVRGFSDGYFDPLAYNDVRWEEIQSVEPAGTIETIDIEVEDNHNFIADGMITHNTALSKVEILREAVKPNQYIQYVAPTYRMAKQIMWYDLLNALPRDWIVKQNDTFLTLTLVNGTRIELKGADNPDTLRGVGLNFLVLDEFQNMTRETWTQVLRPTLSDKHGRALIIGCVRGDTKILTKSGFTNINRVCASTKSKTLTPIDLDLYGINREFHKADNFQDNGVVETRKIKTHYGFELEASLPHPVWTIDNEGHQGWKKTCDLKVGDRVAIARGMEQWGNKSIMNGWEEHYEKWLSSVKRIRYKPTFRETNDLAYFLGLWLAEGSVEEKIGRLTITCGDDLSEYLDERVFGMPFKMMKRSPKSGDCYRWRINSYAIMEFMRYIKMPLTTAPNKHLPEWIWSCSREFAMHLISGIWDGDGCVHNERNKISFVSTSKRMSQEIQLLLSNFGIMTRLYQWETQPTERAKVASMGYRLEAFGEDVIKFKEIYKTRIQRKADIMNGFNPEVVSRRDGVPCLGLLAELKKHFSGLKTIKLQQAIGAARQTNSRTTYPSLREILEECKEAADTEAYKTIQRIVDDHYFQDEIKELEASECHTYDFTVPETHSFWSNGFISHNTPKGYSAFYDMYMLGQKGVPGQASQQFPTITSPFIPASEIEAAKNDMDEKSFLQEFCHVASTKVMKTDGSVCSIRDLRVFDQLWCECEGRRLSCNVVDFKCTGNKEITKLVLENGETFRASSDHKLKVYVDGVAKKVSMRDAEWIERWDEDGKVSKIAVIDRQYDGVEKTYNITVNSPDHSYLLADGTNNYNCASFETMSGRVYYSFDRKRHIKTCPFNEKLPIWVGMDFNIDPMSTVIMQPQPNGDVWCVDEIVQFSSSTTDICHELERKYWRWLDRITIYPDPAGGARQHARGESDLDIMRDMGFTRIKAKSAHPPVADRVNAVNRMLMSADGTVRLYIDPKCKRLITALEQTIYIPGGRDIDKSQGIEHSADALGYAMDIEFPTKKIALVGYSR